MKSKGTSTLPSKSSSSRARLLVSLAVLGILGGGLYSLTQLTISTKITHFLPDGQESKAAMFSSALTQSELVRTIVLSVEATNRKTAAQAARTMTEALRNHEEIQWIESGTSDQIASTVKDLYLGRRLYFLSDHPREEIPSRLSAKGLSSAMDDLKRQLRLPTAALIRGLITRDPLLSFLKRVKQLESSTSEALELVDGQLVSKNGPYGIIFIVTRSSPFKTAKTSLAKNIDEAFAQAQEHGTLRLEQSSVHRFARASEQSIRADITRISLVSAIGIGLLFLVLFRGFRYLLLAFIPIVIGISSALIVVNWAFGTIHGITLAFGASMIGVCIDYVVHLFNHHELSVHDQNAQALDVVWPGLKLGAFTTVAGMLGLLLTDLPGTKEIAIFAGTGVLSALYATKLVLPLFLRQERSPSAVQRALAEKFGNTLAWLESHRFAGLLIWLPAAALICIGIPQLEWNSSMNVLNHLDEALLAEDNRVRQRVFRMESGLIIAAIGDTEEQALQVNDALFSVLKASKNLKSFRSLHSFLWSEKLQRENLATVRATPQLHANFWNALTSNGFKPKAFAQAFAMPTVPPLTYRDLQSSALEASVLPFRIELDGRVAFLNFVHQVKDYDALTRELGGLNDIFLFDQNRFLASSYENYRRRTLQVIPLGLLLVFILLFARFRRLKPTLMAFLPAVVAAAATLGLFGVLGLTANLMHLVALLLVLSIGVDYGVFVAEHRTPGPARSATLLSIMVACLSTVLSFGVLAMSESPALHALGLAVGVGVSIAVVLAPSALVFFPATGDRRV
jgi:predicted exporter